MKGKIFTVIEPEYIDYIGGKWAEHFVDKKHFYIAIEDPTNNGNFKAKNSKNQIKWFNTVTTKLSIVK